MKNVIFALLFFLAVNIPLLSMEQQPKTIVATLLKLQNESDWPHFENFKKMMRENKESMITTRFGEKITHYCKKNSADANVQLLNRWIELKVYDEIQRTEDPHRFFPATLKEMWYLEHGTEPYPYEGIVTKLCHTFIEEDTEQLLQQAKENIEKNINAKHKEQS